MILHGTDIQRPDWPRPSAGLDRFTHEQHYADSTGSIVWAVANTRGAVSLSAFAVDHPMPRAQQAGIAVSHNGLRWLGDSVVIHSPLSGGAVQPCEWLPTASCVQTNLSATDHKLAPDLLALWRDSGFCPESVFRMLSTLHAQHLRSGLD